MTVGSFGLVGIGITLLYLVQDLLDLKQMEPSLETVVLNSPKIS